MTLPSPLYKKTLSLWLNHQAEELTHQELKTLFRNSCVELDRFDVMWENFFEFCQQNRLIAQNDQGFFLTPKGVRFQEESFHLSSEDVVLSQKEVLAKVEAWNFLASQQNLPQVAVLLQFGSTVHQQKQEFKDIDIVIVWRQTPSLCEATNPPLQAQKQMFGALSVLSGLPDNPIHWQVEDQVEQWLEKTKGVSLMSSDVLQELPFDEPFHARMLYQNVDLNNTGVLKKHEQDVLLSIMPFLEKTPSTSSPSF